jgi:murein hydrolase activator
MTSRFVRPAILVLALLCAATLTARGSDDELHKKQTQLEELRKEITKAEDRIREKEKKEHATLELLDAYDHQVLLLRRLIGKLHDQETTLQHTIDDTRKTISGLGGQLTDLKDEYAHYIAGVYKYGRSNDLELLLSSKSLNQLLIRSEYLRRFSDQRRTDLDRIATRRQDLLTQNNLLQEQLSDQKKLIAEKQTEQTKLTQQTKKRKALLAEIRRDKKNIKKEIDRKKQSESDLEQIIARLIEEDRASREQGTSGASKESPEIPGAGGVFESRRGRLRWPVSGGTVAERFGAHEHPTLHTVTQNNGIDIAVPPGTEVQAVADGEVSKIYWLPSFGNLIILNHRNGYRTVYAHLAEISVGEGDRVGEGKRLGTSGETISGASVHFEIYKDREKQNPEVWLSPKKGASR